MKKLLLAAGILFTIALLVPFIRDAAAQRRYYDAPRGLYTQLLVRRVAELEQRVERLERLLPVGPPAQESITVEQAAQQLANAQQRLAHSEELSRKGYISRVQLDAARWEYRRAEKILELAEASRDGDEAKEREIADAIEVLDAKYDLEVATGQLQVAERVSASGFTGPARIESYQRAVDTARKRFDAVKAKAEKE